MAGLPREIRREEAGFLGRADVAELAGGEKAAEVAAGVAGQLFGAGHVNHLGGAIVKVGLELGGQALQEVGSGGVAVVAEDGGVVAPRADAFGDPHGEMCSGAILTSASPEIESGRVERSPLEQVLGTLRKRSVGGGGRVERMR